jgi:hypothetical protein
MLLKALVFKKWLLVATMSPGWWSSHKETYKELFGCSEIDFVMLVGLFFWILTLITLGVITFTILIHFWWFWVCQMLQQEGFKFCLDTRNNKALPLDLVCPEHLKGSFTSRSIPVSPLTTWFEWEEGSFSLWLYKCVLHKLLSPNIKASSCVNYSIIINRASHEFGSTPNGFRAYPITSIAAK